jgi:cytochrome c oxidase subunit 1
MHHLSNAQYSPGIGADLWLVGLAIGGLGTILGGVNFITTIFTMRAPGMTMFRMSIFSWNVFLTSILVLLAFPPLGSSFTWRWNQIDYLVHISLIQQMVVRCCASILFWFFGHPEVYILALPFFGIATEILASL